MNENNYHSNLDEYLKSLSSQVRNVIAKVIKVEREKLHMKTPKSIKHDIRKILTQESDIK